MKKRPEPSGASLIQTGRSSWSCVRTGFNEICGSGCAVTAMAGANRQKTTEARIGNFFMVLKQSAFAMKSKADLLPLECAGMTAL